MTKVSDYHGPIYIVGMPRSGTKLLREVLNSNQDINISWHESNFIPFLVNKYGKNFNFLESSYFSDFWHDFTTTRYYKNHLSNENVLTRNHLLSQNEISDWNSFLKFIFNFYGPKDNARICGDKTPGYLNHIGLLKDISPSSKIIHIVRDPRDYCMSVNKAWGKSIVRAAYRWNKNMVETHMFSSLNLDYYLEIKYEDLLSNSEKTIKLLCDFIGIKYDSKMLYINSKTESVGDALGANRILSTNRDKFIKNLTKDEIKLIEQVAYNGMRLKMYDILYAKNGVLVSPIKIKYLKFYDALKILSSKSDFHSLKDEVGHYFRRAWRN